MRRSDLGEFEELVLLAVAVFTPEAYSVVIAEELEQQTGKTVTTGAVHAALQRLENKGLLASQMGEATAERGGRRLAARSYDSAFVARGACETVPSLRGASTGALDQKDSLCTFQANFRQSADSLAHG